MRSLIPLGISVLYVLHAFYACIDGRGPWTRTQDQSNSCHSLSVLLAQDIEPRVHIRLSLLYDVRLLDVSMSDNVLCDLDTAFQSEPTVLSRYSQHFRTRCSVWCYTYASRSLQTHSWYDSAHSCERNGPPAVGRVS